MSQKQRNQLVHVNRALILVLTLIGMTLDGINAADVFLTIALIVWLWLPQCMRIEGKILAQIDSAAGSKPANTQERSEATTS